MGERVILDQLEKLDYSEGEIKGGGNMKGGDTIKKIPKNAWIIMIALGVGYLLYRNIHRN